MKTSETFGTQTEDTKLVNINNFKQNIIAQDEAYEKLLVDINNHTVTRIKISDILNIPFNGDLKESHIGINIKDLFKETAAAEQRILKVLEDLANKAKTLKITELDLSSMNIGQYENVDAIMNSINKIIKNSSTIHTINLSSNKLDSYKLPKKILSVDNVDLSNNDISDLAWAKSSEFTCKTLNLSNNNKKSYYDFNALHINDLIKCGKDLTDLDISNNNLKLDDINKYMFVSFNPLEMHPSLQHLKCTDIEADDKTLINLTAILNGGLTDQDISFGYNCSPSLGNKILKKIEFSQNTLPYINASIRYLIDQDIDSVEHLSKFAEIISKSSLGIKAQILLKLVGIGFDRNIQEIIDLRKLINFDKVVGFLEYPKTQMFDILINQGFIKHIEVEESRVQNCLFKYARQTNFEIIKKLLSIFPQLINVVDKEGHSIGSYFSHDPEILNNLFELGYIPKGDEYANKEQHKLSDIKGSQTVHDPRINDANNFYIKTLKQESDYKPDQEDAQKLCKSIKDYSGFVSTFSKKLPFDFLSMEYIKQALTYKESLQHTKSFLEGKTSEQTVARIVEIVLNALQDKYLKVGSNYADYSHQYDYSDQKYKVTLKELILEVYHSILNRALSNEEVRGVLVDAIKHNIAEPEVLKLIGLENYTGNENLYTLVNGKTIEESSKIFETITGASLKDYIVHKDLFTMMCQLFKAATTYGENNEACKHGITAQVAQTLCIVDSKYIEKYSKHQAVKTEELNEHNISGIVEKIVELLLSNEDPNFAKELSDFATIGNTNKMPIIVIKAINTGFLEIASKQLPYFKTHIPTVEDYSLLIQSIRVNKLFVDGLSHEFMSNESNEFILAESYTQLNPFSEAMKELQIKQAVAAALGYILDETEFNVTGEVGVQDYIE